MGCKENTCCFSGHRRFSKSVISPIEKRLSEAIDQLILQGVTEGVQMDRMERNYVAVDINSLVDIRSVVIDQSLPVHEKRQSYLQQIKTPEICRCGDTILRISHVNTGTSLADRVKQYLLSKQGISLIN